MTKPTTTTRRLSRFFHLRAAVMGVALALVAAGCGVAPEEDDGTVGVESVQCPNKLDAWAPGTPYKVGDLVAFTGGVFQCRQAHTAQSDWAPNIVPALWTKVQCGGATPPVTTTPPANNTPPVTTTPPPATTTPPPANNGGQCVGGPKFDPAGTKNVGNGHGLQFIGGQCLRAADCASGCCALPCGICSGPGAQFQAGKLGCGFGGDPAVAPAGGGHAGGATLRIALVIRVHATFVPLDSSRSPCSLLPESKVRRESKFASAISGESRQSRRLAR